MPQRPFKPCNHPGCPELVTTGYCDKHKKDEQNYGRYRGSSTERGYNTRWQKVRTIFLRKNPLCVECKKEGSIQPATVVDHVIPHKGDMVLFWNKDNWQPLCKKHHDIKTAKVDGGFGNKKRMVKC